jgi:hypothetical protein
VLGFYATNGFHNIRADGALHEDLASFLFGGFTQNSIKGSQNFLRFSSASLNPFMVCKNRSRTLTIFMGILKVVLIELLPHVPVLPHGGSLNLMKFPTQFLRTKAWFSLPLLFRSQSLFHHFSSDSEMKHKRSS